MPSGKFINLRAKTYQESDLLVDALSKQGERVTFSAKNAVQSRKRFAGGVLEPFNFVQINFTEARSGFLYIQEAKLIYPFSGLRSDYKKIETASYFSKLILKATKEGLQDNKMLFDLLGNALKTLETSQKTDLLKLHFELKYLFYLGFHATDKDSEEFISKPINFHQQIQLTDDEYFYLKQKTKKQLEGVSLQLSEFL